MYISKLKDCLKPKKRKVLNSQKGDLVLGMAVAVSQVLAIVGLSAVMMGTSANTVSQANYAKFVQEFGEFSDSVTIQWASAKADMAVNGVLINNAQGYYIAANDFNDFSDLNSNEIDNILKQKGISDMILPTGYVIPKPIQKALRQTETNLSDNYIVAYLINDNAINGYERKENLDFYEVSNGTEYHLVTSDGKTFTIPGYPEEQEDGSIKYHIDSHGAYYIVAGKKSDISIDENIIEEPIQASDFKELHGINKDGQTTNESPIYKTKLVRK